MSNWILTRGPSLRRRVLLSAVFLVPVTFLRVTNDQTNLPKLAVILVALSLVAPLRGAEILQGAQWRGLKRLLVPALAFLVPLLIGWAFSPYKAWALFGQYERLQGLIPYAVIILFGMALADAFPGRAIQLAWALTASAAVVGTYALVQYLGFDPLDWFRPGGADNEAGSTLGNPNFTGGFLGIVLPVSLSLVLLERNRRAIASILLAGVLAGWVVAFSQGGWGAGVAGCAILLAFALRERVPYPYVIGGVVVAVVAALAIGLVLLGSLTHNNPLVPGTALVRSSAWVGAAQMTADYPVVGRGPNAFAIEGTSYRPPGSGLFADYNYPDDPHSVLLSLTVAAGVFGLIGFGLFLWWVTTQVRRLREPSMLQVAFLGALVAYVTQSLVSIDEVTLRTTLWVALAGFVVAALPTEAQSRASRSTRKRPPPKKRLQQPLGVVLLGLVALGGFWWSIQSLVADARALQGEKLAAEGRFEEARIEFGRALAFREESEYHRLAGLRLATAALAEEDGRERFDAALEQFQFTRDVPVVARLAELGRVLDAGSRYDTSYDERALAVFEQISELDPTNPAIAAERADVLIDLSRVEDALEVLAAFEDQVRPDRQPEFFGVLALALAASGEDERSRAVIERLPEEDLDEEHVVRALEFLETGAQGATRTQVIQENWWRSYPPTDTLLG